MSLFLKKSPSKHTVWRVIGYSLLFCIVFSLLFCGIATVYYTKRYATLDMHLFSLQLRAQEKTTLLAPAQIENTIAPHAGEVHLYANEHRIYAPYEAFPDDLVNAFVSIEDKRFFEHHGVDWRRTTGAVFDFVRGKSSYGGSTITQQLIKNVTGESQVSPARKLKEIARARQLEKHFTKEEILELYLNTVYLSQRCYGVKTAADFYFDTDVSDLTTAQCASLAAIIQAPTKWDPIVNPENHIERRNTVLYTMYQNGYLTEEDYEDAVNTPLETVENTSAAPPVLSWYAEYAVEEATRILQDVYGMEQEAARRFLYCGGFTVETAENVEVQQTLESVYQNKNTVPRADNSLIQPQSAAVVIEPHTGAVLGLVGSVGEKKENRILNYATQTKRPPGSAIKPLSVYAPAMQAGRINYATVYDDTPYDFTTKESGWPQNYPNVYGGLTPVHDALRRSVNTVAVKILADYGVENSFDFLKNHLGISSLVLQKQRKDGTLFTDCALAPLALGQLTYGVSVLELTAGYTVLADEGTYHAPYAIERIIDAAGEVVYTHQTNAEGVLSRGNAQVMTQMLREVAQSGTASALTLPQKVEVAGKTGTTTDDCDRWFVGYTKDYLCGVWFGYATPQPLTAFSETASPALRLWDAVMTPLCQNAIVNGDRRAFDTSALIRTSFCRDSGKLPTATCHKDPRGNRIEVGYFTPEQLPLTHCDCHIDVLYDHVSGGVSFGACPPDHLTTVGMIRVPYRDFPNEVIVKDAQYVYRSTEFSPPSLDATQPFFANTIADGHFCGKSNVTFPFNRACPDLALSPIFDDED